MDLSLYYSPGLILAQEGQTVPEGGADQVC